MGRINDEIRAAKYSVAILCGGRSSRMGQDKAEMKIQAGGPRMVDRLLAAFSECDEILLSVRDKEQLADHTSVRDKEQLATHPEVLRVADPVPGAGPIAGIVASLRECRHELLFVTAVDMPYMDRKFAEELLRSAEIRREAERSESVRESDRITDTMAGVSPDGDGGVFVPVSSDRDGDAFVPVNPDGDWDVLVPVDPDGRPHPLCAFYRKSALPVLEENLKAGTYSLWRSFRELRTRRVPVESLEDSTRKLMNLNRPEDVSASFSVKDCGEKS